MKLIFKQKENSGKQKIFTGFFHKLKFADQEYVRRQSNESIVEKVKFEHFLALFHEFRLEKDLPGS